MMLGIVAALATVMGARYRALRFLGPALGQLSVVEEELPPTVIARLPTEAASRRTMGQASLKVP
jgi:hypothetical protein